MAEANAASRAQSATRCRPASETASAVPQAPAPRTAMFMEAGSPRTSVKIRVSETPDLTDLDVAGLAVGVAHPDPASRRRLRDIEGDALPRLEHQRRPVARGLPRVRDGGRHDHRALVRERLLFHPGEVARLIAHL